MSSHRRFSIVNNNNWIRWKREENTESKEAELFPEVCAKSGKIVNFYFDFLLSLSGRFWVVLRTNVPLSKCSHQNCVKNESH